MSLEPFDYGQEKNNFGFDLSEDAMKKHQLNAEIDEYMKHHNLRKREQMLS